MKNITRTIKITTVHFTKVTNALNGCINDDGIISVDIPGGFNAYDAEMKGRKLLANRGIIESLVFLDHTIHFYKFKMPIDAFIKHAERVEI